MVRPHLPVEEVLVVQLGDRLPDPGLQAPEAVRLLAPKAGVEISVLAAEQHDVLQDAPEAAADPARVQFGCKPRGAQKGPKVGLPLAPLGPEGRAAAKARPELEVGVVFPPFFARERVGEWMDRSTDR